MLNYQNLKSNRNKKKLVRFFISLCHEITKKVNRYKKIKVKNKNSKDFDPVTNLDRLIEKYIRYRIGKSFPDHKIVGEEFDDKKTKSDYTWVIDPIDGTKNFIMGIPTWSNLIGLLYKKKSIISLANFPALNIYYLAFNNKTYKYSHNKRKLLKNNNKFKKNPNIVINTLSAYKSSNVKKIEKKFKGIFKISGNDALNFCLVAEGKIDVLIEKGLKKVDYLPLMSIIANSGSIITDWKGKTNFNQGDVLVSGNKKNHFNILKTLKEK